MSHPKLYLAGPSVFAPNAKYLSIKQAALCQIAGFEPLHPLDGSLSPDQFASRSEWATAIRAANEDMIRLCDGVVADLSPFRGPGMDNGTAYEIGFARALRKPVAGYMPTIYRREYIERTREYLSLSATAEVDHTGMSIEDFGLADNLMMTTSLVCLSNSLEEALDWLKLNRGVLDSNH